MDLFLSIFRLQVLLSNLFVNDCTFYPISWTPKRKFVSASFSFIIESSEILILTPERIKFLANSVLLPVKATIKTLEFTRLYKKYKLWYLI